MAQGVCHFGTGGVPFWHSPFIIIPEPFTEFLQSPRGAGAPAAAGKRFDILVKVFSGDEVRKIRVLRSIFGGLDILAQEVV